MILIALVASVAAGLVLPPVVHAEETAEIEWVRQFGTSSRDQAYGISVDSTGIYVAGRTNGTLPGQKGGKEAESDAFVRKYTSEGTEVWTRQFGTSSNDIAYGISVDSTSIYVIGTTDGKLRGQPKVGIKDAFVRKYDSEGNEVWTRQFGTENTDYGLAISASSIGVFVAGYTYGTFPGETNAGGLRDAFVRKYNTDGSEVWTRQFGTTSSEFALAISSDSTGIYVAGYTAGTFPGQTKSGGSDAFVRKYSADGEEVWTRQFGTPYSDSVRAISVSNTGVYTVGVVGGTLPNQSTSGGNDAFIRKYGTDGEEMWTRQFGTPSLDVARGIVVDLENLYVAGATEGNLTNQDNFGGRDAFVRHYEANGELVWTRQFGSASQDNERAISADSTGIYVAGETFGTLPGQTALGDSDAYVVKLSSPATSTATITGAVTDSATISPIQGATVLVDTGQSSTTDAEGKYTLNNVPTGNRTIAVSAEGYVPRETQVTVSESGVNEMNFVLVAEKGSGGPDCNKKPEHPKC